MLWHRICIALLAEVCYFILWKMFVCLRGLHFEINYITMFVISVQSVTELAYNYLYTYGAYHLLLYQWH